MWLREPRFLGTYPLVGRQLLAQNSARPGGVDGIALRFLPTKHVPAGVVDLTLFSTRQLSPVCPTPDRVEQSIRGRGRGDTSLGRPSALSVRACPGNLRPAE